MKTGPVSEQDRQTVRENLDKDPSEVAKLIDRTERLAGRLLEEEKEKHAAEVAAKKSEPTLFERTMGKATNSTVMTPAASEIRDELRKRKVPGRDQGHIFKIK